MEANWADGVADNRSVEFEKQDGTVKRFELGLCPEEAYKNMIDCAISNIGNEQFWQRQFLQDLWIHERIQF
jgi:hypothetical protein